MNKGNKILVGILAFVLVCVVGYALFSETITVTGSATASGNWKITTTCTKGLSNEVILPNDKLVNYKDNGYQNDSCTVDGANVNFNVDLLYPSAERTFTIKVENNGSIPAVFDLEEADEDGGFSNTTISVCEINENNEKINCSSELNYVGEKNSGSSRPVVFGVLGAKDKDGNFYHSYSDGGLGDHFIDENNGFVIQPGESLFYEVSIFWTDNFDNLENKANYSIDVSTQLKFIQVQ